MAVEFQRTAEKRSIGPFISSGTEWIVDAYECDPEALQQIEILRGICDELVRELRLRVIGEPQQHVFAGAGGVTCLYLLSESHLACHTYPEFGLATFNLYCCRKSAEWDWEAVLKAQLRAARIDIRRLQRGQRQQSGVPRDGSRAK